MPEMSSEDNANSIVEQASEGAEATETEEERLKISWPYTKGEGHIPLRFFDLVDVPEFPDDEPNEQGKILMAMISEIMHLKETVAFLVKERQKASFEQWLATQGKTLREPGVPTDLMSQVRNAKT